MNQIDLNSDMGESFGVYTLGNDEALMRSITSANIACGFHAGDPTVIRRTIRLAKASGVAVGAHPSFPDLSGFGRRPMQMDLGQLEDLVLYQIAAVAGVASSDGVKLRHVKPHGSLGNMAHKDFALAQAFVRAVAAFDSTLPIFALPGGELVKAAQAAGVPVAYEVFADRAYEPDGALVSRTKAGAMIHDPDTVVKRVIRVVKEGTLAAIDGTTISLHADTICTHGDTQGAHELTRLLRAGLEAEGIRVVPFGDLATGRFGD